MTLPSTTSSKKDKPNTRTSTPQSLLDQIQKKKSTMLERLAAKLLQHMLSKYFEQPPPAAAATTSSSRNSAGRATTSTSSGSFALSTSAIWSGFVTYHNLQLKADVLNQIMLGQGRPFRVEFGVVRNLTITIPWGKLASADSPIVVVLDGVFVLMSVELDFDDDALRKHHKDKRMKQLREGTQKIGTDEQGAFSWKEYLKKKLQEGLLPALSERIEIHCRNFHFRIEDTATGPHPFAFGVVLESLHVQKDEEGDKYSQLNHLGIYVSSVEERPYSASELAEHCVMRLWSASEILSALDKTIARRISDASSVTSYRAPAHTYLLMPVDGSLRVAFTTPAQQLRDRSPPARFVLEIPYLNFELRDVQCLQVLGFYYETNTHKYRRTHYRLRRPYGTVRENARAWWWYAYSCVCLELRKHHRQPLSRRFARRQRYCDLYERKVVGCYAADDAAGPTAPSANVVAETNGGARGEGSDGMVALAAAAPAAPRPRRPVPPLSLLEEQELRDLEDGTEGDLTVQDILLFRILVHRRIGYLPTAAAALSRQDSTSATTTRSWFQRIISKDDDVVEQDYQRLVADWQSWTEEQARTNEIASTQGLSPVAVAVELMVAAGHVSLFSPLESTVDLTGPRRLQRKFLDYSFTRFAVDFDLMRDFDSLEVRVSLQEYAAYEVRSDQMTYQVVRRADPADVSALEPDLPPIVQCAFSKTPHASDYHIGLEARVREIQVTLHTESEWLGKMKALIRPLPQFEKATNFWKALNMASINSWMSNQLGLLVKANTVVAEHKRMNLDVQVDCPLLRLLDAEGNSMLVNLGRVHFRTEKLAGDAHSVVRRQSVTAASTSRSIASVRFTSTIIEETTDSDGGVENVGVQASQRRQARASSRAGDRSVYGWWNPSGGDSVDLGASVRYADSVNGDYYLTNELEGSTDIDADLFFYDVFELCLEPGGVFIESSEDDNWQLVAPMEVTIHILKSVLQADHTLSRYKIRFSVPDVSISLSDRAIVLVAMFASKWRTMLASSVIQPRLQVKVMYSPGLGVVPPTPATEHDWGTDGGSAFDENEFFDAAENDAAASEQVGTTLDEAWMADSESVVDSEAKSFAGRSGRRGRRRQMSDLSSISDGSTKLRRANGFREAYYLSAENLARLEEEAAVEDPGENGYHENDDWSFKSAISIRQLEIVEHELEEGIVKQQSHIDSLRHDLSALRQGTTGNHSDTVDAVGDKSKLVRDLQRAQLQLKTLETARSAISEHKRSLTECANQETIDDVHHRASLSLQAASTILSSRRRLEKEASTSGPDHVLTQNLKQDTLVCSISVHSLHFRFSCRQGGNVGSGDSGPTFDVSVMHSGCVVRKRSGESKVFASVEHAAASFLDFQSQKISFLHAGVNYDVAGSLLPSILPHLVSAPSIEEKLLRFALEVRNGSSAQAKSVSHSKCRLVVGDVEATATPIILSAIREATTGLNVLLVKPGEKERKDDAVAKPARTSHTSIRVASVRCVFCESDVYAALVLSDVGFRFAVARQRIGGERSETNGSCSNVQVLWIRDYEAGHATELFGKQDTGSPIVHFRLRTQDVDESEDGGWVVERQLVKTLVDSRHHTLNAHLGLKVGSFSTTIFPECAASIGTSLHRLRLSWTAPIGAAYSPQNAPTVVPPRRKKTRWRLDCSMKKSCVALQERINCHDRFVKQSDPKFVASCSVMAVIQPTASPDRDLSLNITVQDASVMRAPDEAFILEPVTACISMEVPLTNRFPKPSRHPQLTVPDTSTWSVGLPTFAPKESNMAKCQINATFTVLSDIRVRLTPSTLKLFRIRLSELSHAVRSIRNSVGESQRITTKTNGKKSDRSIGMLVRFAAVSLSIARENAISADVSRRAETMVVFYAEEVELGGVVSGPCISTDATVAYGSVTDFTHRAGIQTFKGGSRNAIKSNGSSRTSKLLEVNCSITDVFDRKHVDLKLVVGGLQFLPLPCCIRSIIEFTDEAMTRIHVDGFSTRDDTGDSQPGNGSKIASFAFEARCGVFECLLSSRDLPKYLRESSDQAVGVVVFRLNLEAIGLGRLTNLATSNAPDEFIGSCDSAGIRESLVRYLTDRVAGPGTGMSTELTIRATAVQVLRTTIVKSSTVPVIFAVKPPLIGEQRITNAFHFSLAHHAVLLVTPTSETRESERVMSAAHSLRINAGFVDVLLYIAQSTGGVNDAIRTSAIPIVELFKKKEETSKTSGPGLKETLLCTPFACAIEVEGFKVTCVPGGATRLTESPIVKLTLSKVTGGLAMSPLSSDWKLLPNSGDEQVPSIKDVKVKHIFLGGWCICDASAYYNNRRLVEWEPFIEPWKLEAVIGVDLSRAAKLGPFMDDKPLETRTEVSLQPQRSNPLDFSGARLRDIGRLLRSPFQLDHSAGKSEDILSQKEVQSSVDFCYLKLASMCNETLSLATFRRGSSEGRFSSVVLPQDRPISWLHQFGYPTDADPSPKQVLSQPAILCKLVDSGPLNINLTGALIENLSDHVGKENYGAVRRLAPHWIRNDSGLTVRFQEVLDGERQGRGETAPTITLGNDSEVELPLKRSLAQSCDPHTAFISVELGSFEDTIGRLNSSLDLRKGSRSSTFAYRVKIKVPVDTVGMRRYPIDWNQEKRDLTGSSDSGNLGWVIIRVALRRGIKVVTIESPLILKNTSDVDLLCEVRDHDGLSLMWRSLVPRERHEASGYVPVPADIVPIIHSKAYRFSVVALAKEPRVRHESEVPPCDKTLFSRLQAPRPYSRNSLTKGIIDQSHIGVRQLLANESGRRPFYMTGNVNLNLCSIRIGSIALDQASRAVASTSDLEIPEQRMLLFRSTLAVSNHLPYPLRVQVRVKVEQSTTGVSSREAQLRSSWFELGVLDCGEVTNWTGASATDKIEIRVGFSEGKSTLLPALVSWSSVSLIPSLEESSFLPSSSSRLGFMALPELKLPGAYDVPAPLHISTALTRGSVAADLATASTSVKHFSTSVPEAGRVVGLYVPFWIVDETGLDLQFKSGLFSSAQEGLYRHRTSRREHSHKLQAALGLGELLDDNNMTHLPSRNAYEVFMIGNEGSNRLYVRRRTSRFLNVIAPWSDPIPLTLSDNHFYDTNVFPPALSIGEANDDDHLVNDDSETFALRSRLLQAPASLGGRYGTRFVHVVCRYAIVNQLCREIEISGTDDDSKPTAVVPCFHPTPIHFNDTKPIRFRPKEFGWAWSGRFHVRRSRREVTLFLAHKIKGTKILVTVEIVSKQKPGTCILIFRESPYSPYRLENRTVFALHYRQISSLFEVDAIPRNLNSSPGPILLPYHDAEFAWDEPESSRHSIALSIADLGEQFKDKSSLFIGSVRIDRIAPGTTFRLRSGRFTGQVISDGPTRVLRIMESQKSESPNHADDLNVEESSTTGLTWMLTAKLLHGVGVSLVDWVPQELVYLKLEDVFIEKLHGGTERKLTSAIGRIVVNNQLWVTPYPVALRVGSQSQRRRHRRHSALSLSWNRREASGTGRGNMTMFQFIEFSMEPITLFVDGNLTNHLIGMYRQAKAIGLATNAREGAMLRNQVLNETLGLQEDVYLRSDLVVNPHRTVVDDLYYTVDSVASVAVAAKLRNRYRVPSIISSAATGFPGVLLPIPGQVTKVQHKFYVERLRISTIAADISWSGPLPIASSLPGLLRPAFTFEGLPVLLRPLSSMHSYGTIDEHVLILRSHYISIWRILDLLVGVLRKPSFLARAVLFTWRESVGSAFDSLSSNVQSTESLMLKLTTAIEAQPVRPVYWSVAGPFVKFNLAFVHGLATFTSAGSRLLRYNAARHRASGVLVRSRNPRLFANVNGKDLLVEYVEGDSAGKAFLSRVAMGMYLGEGYNFHTEGIRLSLGQSSRYDTEASTFILMLTFERVMMLSGLLNATFCDVVWESHFADVVYVEVAGNDNDAKPQEPTLASASNDTISARFVIVVWWFLRDAFRDVGRDERLARAAVGDRGGLDTLESRRMYIPRDSAPQLLAKIQQTSKRWIDEGVVSISVSSIDTSGDK